MKTIKRVLLTTVATVGMLGLITGTGISASSDPFRTGASMTTERDYTISGPYNAPEAAPDAGAIGSGTGGAVGTGSGTGESMGTGTGGTTDTDTGGTMGTGTGGAIDTGTGGTTDTGTGDTGGTDGEGK